MLPQKKKKKKKQWHHVLLHLPKTCVVCVVFVTSKLFSSFYFNITSMLPALCKLSHYILTKYMFINLVIKFKGNYNATIYSLI